MRIEKLNEDRIRITLNMEDLKQKEIDFHSFMSNSLESQRLFLDMLEEAEKEVGFITKDYKIMIEALATTDGSFILTVTRMIPDLEKENAKKKKVLIKRKTLKTDASHAIYCFNCLDDFCEFCTFIYKTDLKKISTFADSISLFSYQNKYYLNIKDVNTDFKFLKGFYSSLTEFGYLVSSPELFERKLLEYGTVLVPQNAIAVFIKHFVKKTRKRSASK